MKFKLNSWHPATDNNSSWQHHFTDASSHWASSVLNPSINIQRVLFRSEDFPPSRFSAKARSPRTSKGGAPVVTSSSGPWICSLTTPLLLSCWRSVRFAVSIRHSVMNTRTAAVGLQVIGFYTVDEHDCDPMYDLIDHSYKLKLRLSIHVIMLTHAASRLVNVCPSDSQ